MSLQTFETLESRVRCYSRAFPTVFTRAQGALLFDERGRRYVDFFAGAGTLNYGHNNPRLKRRLLEYLEADGIVHSLDMATAAKREFLERLNDVVLAPRGLSYKVQFPGPTGTNGVEAALKLARKVTGRAGVIAFTRGYHGVSLGALATTANAEKRAGAGVPLEHVVRMPFDGFLGEGVDTLAYVAALLESPGSGVDLPAAAIVETIQAEGGIHVARPEWLRGLAELLARNGVLLIVDDIQVGCGRTGPFFSFEPAGIRPDMVVLSKSISGYGTPLSLLLLRPELDLWKPGEHNGTFRGNNLAFVTGAEALSYWQDGALTAEVERKGEEVRRALEAIAADFPEAGGRVRGKGLIQGLALGLDGLADRVSAAAFERGLVIETAGPRSEVLKVLPPLLIEAAELAQGLGVLRESVGAALAAVEAEKARSQFAIAGD